MSIKKLQRKRGSQPSNLTIRHTAGKMGPDRMSDLRGPGGIQSPSAPLAGQDNLQQRSEDVNQKDSSEKK
jgi:hypothetical protein